MFKIPYEDVVSAIEKKTNLPKDEIEKKVKEKLKALSGLISKEGAAHIVANELGVKLLEPFTGKLQIKNVMSGMRDVETSGKVLAVYELKTFTSKDRAGKVASLFIGDETGSIRVTLWGDQADSVAKIKEGDIVTIISGYVRENNGRKELHLNEKSKLLINPEGIVISNVQSSSRAPSEKGVRKSVSELSENDSNIEILGTLVQLYEPRFFEVCPTCSKRARATEGVATCASHGPVTPAYSYVMNGMVDDGTGQIRVVFFREQASSLLHMEHNAVLNFKDAPMQFEPLKTELLGNIIKISGKVTKNAMFDRMELVARTIDSNPDPKEELARLESQ